MATKKWAFDFSADFGVDPANHQYFNMQDLQAIGGGFQSKLPGAGAWTSQSGWMEIWGDQLNNPIGGPQINGTGHVAVELDVWADNAVKPASFVGDANSYHDTLQNTISTCAGQTYSFSVGLALREDLSLGQAAATSGVKLSFIDATTGRTLSTQIVTPSSYQGDTFTFAFTAASGKTVIKFEELNGQDHDGFGALIYDPTVTTANMVVVQPDNWWSSWCGNGNNNAGSCGADDFVLTSNSGDNCHNPVRFDNQDILSAQAGTQVTKIQLGGSNAHAEVVETSSCFFGWFSHTEVDNVSLSGSPVTIDMSNDASGVTIGFACNDSYNTKTILGSQQSDYIDVSNDNGIKYVNAGGGDDVVVARANVQAGYDGGCGVNTFRMIGNAQIDLANHFASGATIMNFQNIAGSGNLIGDCNNNVITAVAGCGTTVMTGGGGADTFKFEGGAVNSVITDFNWKEGDHVDLSGTAFTSRSNFCVKDDGNGNAIMTAGNNQLVFLHHTSADIYCAISHDLIHLGSGCGC